METEWVPQMSAILGIEPESLPVIWDADFLYGPRDDAGADTYVLCEINVSSCFAIPDEAPAAIAQDALARCRAAPPRAIVSNRKEAPIKGIVTASAFAVSLAMGFLVFLGGSSDAQEDCSSRSRKRWAKPAPERAASIASACRGPTSRRRWTASS
jgi:hypothetical protein